MKCLKWKVTFKQVVIASTVLFCRKMLVRLGVWETAILFKSLFLSTKLNKFQKTIIRIKIRYFIYSNDDTTFLNAHLKNPYFRINNLSQLSFLLFGHLIDRHFIDRLSIDRTIHEQEISQTGPVIDWTFHNQPGPNLLCDLAGPQGKL